MHRIDSDIETQVEVAFSSLNELTFVHTATGELTRTYGRIFEKLGKQEDEDSKLKQKSFGFTESQYSRLDIMACKKGFKTTAGKPKTGSLLQWFADGSLFLDFVKARDEMNGLHHSVASLKRECQALRHKLRKAQNRERRGRPKGNRFNRIQTVISASAKQVKQRMR